MKIIEAAHTLASAIARRDEQTVASLLAPDFALRTPGGQSLDARAFIATIRAIPGDIVFVQLHHLHVDQLQAGGALVTGIQHARVRLDHRELDDRRPFVDYFTLADDNTWRLQLALDLPPYPDATD